MTMETKQEIFQRYLREYLQGSKKEKGRILDTVCEVVGIHRKAAIRKFRSLQMRRSDKQESRGRPVVYGPDVTAALKCVWEVSNQICAELLHTQIGPMVQKLQEQGEWKHRPAPTAQLLKISEGSIKVRLRTFTKSAHNMRGMGATRPSDIQELIPVEYGPWRDKPPGYGQIDSVAHCGTTLSGTYVYTVNYTDIATSWGVRRAQWNKTAQQTKQSMIHIRNTLPFALKGAHPDSGSEYINYEVWGWCKEQTPQIALTRSRPYMKNDNAYVEQKNGDKVRRWLGYHRYGHPDLVMMINEFYRLLDLYDNFFITTRRCSKKKKVGSKYIRVYKKAKTPYQRVLAHPNMTMDVKTRLQQQYKTLNPVALKKQLDTLRIKIRTQAKLLGNFNNFPE